MKNVKNSPAEQACKAFLLLLLNGEIKITYWNMQGKSWVSMPLMEEGVLHRTSIFSHPISIWRHSKYTISHLVKKKTRQYACAHTIVTLCTIKEWGRGKMKEERNPHNSNWDVVEPNCGFLTENVVLVCGDCDTSCLCWSTLTVSSNFISNCAGMSISLVQLAAHENGILSASLINLLFTIGLR